MVTSAPLFAEAEEHVLGLGAVLTDFQPGGRRFRVFIDLAGHPFCLVARAAAVLRETTD